MLRRTLSLFLVLCTALPLLFSCTPEPEPDPYEGKLLLAENGTSDYRIVIPKDPTEEMRAIAGELQSYFAEISDVILPVVEDDTEPQACEIILGDTTRNEGEDEIPRKYLGQEGFVIRNVADSILISGGQNRGTLYGVYSFLEEYLGVRYWAEGEETVPHQPIVALDRFTEDNLQKPGFDFRLQTHQSAASFNEKQHLNAAWSGDDQPISGGIEYTGPWYVHTFGPLLGWKSNERYCRQPCLSDPAVYEKMFNSAVKYIEASPDATVIAISQNDSTLAESGECTCDKCKAEIEKYGSSGAMLNFINRLANALKSKFPHIYVETLAYYYTWEPPKGGVTAGDNVIVRFCNAGACMMHSFTNEDGDPDLFYVNNNLKAQEYLEGWAEAAEHLYVWDYNIDFGSTLSTIPNFDRLYENITAYYECGVDGIYMQGLRDGGEFDRLRGYLASKLLWNPKMTKEEFEGHKKDFLFGYYGKAGKDVSKYIDYITEMCEDTHPSMYHDITRFWPMELDENGKADTTHLDAMMKYYNNALKHAESYEIERRVRRTLLPILYYETLLCAMETHGTLEKDEEPTELMKLNEALYYEMLLGGVGLVKEGVSLPAKPNFKNTLLYWGWDGSCIYNDETATAHEEAKKKEEEEKENADKDEKPDVTEGLDSAEEAAEKK